MGGAGGGCLLPREGMVFIGCQDRSKELEMLVIVGCVCVRVWSIIHTHPVPEEDTVY